MAQFETTLNTTISKYLKGAEDNVVFAQKWLGLLKQKGRITYNHSGKNLDWGVEAYRANGVGYADGDPIGYTRQNRWKRATLDWRGYAYSDKMSLFERQQNRGTQALIDRWSEMIPKLLNDASYDLNFGLYVDGEATGYTKGIHGIESFLGTSGSDSGVAEAPSDTYASLSTILGNYGGSWTGNWPVGTGSPEYGFWSPIIVDYTDAGFAGSSATWAVQGEDAMRFLITYSQLRHTAMKGMDLIFLEADLYRQMKKVITTKEQINVNRNQKEGLLSLGFTDMFNFDGVEVTTEFGVPSACGYGVNTSQMELCSLFPKLFQEQPIAYDENTADYKFSMFFFGNAKFNPRYFGKLLAAGT